MSRSDRDDPSAAEQAGGTNSPEDPPARPKARKPRPKKSVQPSDVKAVAQPEKPKRSRKRSATAGKSSPVATESPPVAKKRPTRKKSAAKDSAPLLEIASSKDVIPTPVAAPPTVEAAPPAPAMPTSLLQEAESSKLSLTTHISAETPEAPGAATAVVPVANFAHELGELFRRSRLILPIAAAAAFFALVFFIVPHEKPQPQVTNDVPFVINAAAPEPHQTDTVPASFGTLSEYDQLADAQADIALGNDLVPMPVTRPASVESGLTWGVRTNHIFDLMVHNPADKPIAAFLMEYSGSACDTPPVGQRWLVMRPPHPLQPDKREMISADANADLYSVGACLSILAVYAPR